MTTGVKTKLLISAEAPATFDAAGWGAVAGWAETACKSEIPDIVLEKEKITFDCLSSGAEDIARGILRSVDLDLAFKVEPTNPAEILLKSAFDADEGTSAELVSCKVVNKTNTRVRYFQAMVIKFGDGKIVMSEHEMRMVGLSFRGTTYVEVNS